MEHDVDGLATAMHLDDHGGGVDASSPCDGHGSPVEGRPEEVVLLHAEFLVALWLVHWE
jgi:hypothetical protein